MLVHVFPGQGSQYQGMGERYFEKYPAELRAAERVLGYSLKDLCLRNGSRRLDETRFTQPALYVVGALSFLDQGGSAPDFVVGHSLGEFVALFAAEAFDFETGLRLVKSRAEAMHECQGGGMAAVIGADAATLGRILAENGLSDLDIANYNAAAQHVVAGPLASLQRARSIFKGKGYPWVRLNVSGAFHSRYMSGAKERFATEVAKVVFEELKVPVVANVTGRPHVRANIAARLVSQLDQPVQWEESVRYLLKCGAVEFLEMAPGAVLSKLIESVADGGATVRQVDPVAKEPTREQTHARSRVVGAGRQENNDE